MSSSNSRNVSSFTLHSSIVNATIGALSHQADSGFSSIQNVDSEIVDYAVLVRPFQSISSGVSNVEFSMSCNFEGNIVFRPKTTSALAFNLFKNHVVPQKPGTPYHLPFSPAVSEKFGHNLKGGNWFTDTVAPFVLQSLPSLANMASTAMKVPWMLPAPESFRDKEEESVISKLEDFNIHSNQNPQADTESVP